ncbi:hypothetical protein [Microbacterium luticocti]|uniref:hypothetical protein n=1 Tax=Microbacterium luticocti TaxID=451764 RepID=UPI00048AAB2C|nr:hypothetical protein [Microbacterium luticocti]
MLSGRIRPIETRELSIDAESIDDARAQAEAELPAGWVLTDAAATMAKASTRITLNVKMARRDGVRDIEADDMQSLYAQVPAGWQLLSVRED